MSNKLTALLFVIVVSFYSFIYASYPALKISLLIALNGYAELNKQFFIDEARRSYLYIVTDFCSKNEPIELFVGGINE